MANHYDWVRARDGLRIRTGMKVVGWGDKAKRENKREGTVKYLYNFNGSNDSDVVVYLNNAAGNLEGAWLETVELACPPLDIGRPIRCRDSNIEVISVMVGGDLNRPICATLTLPNGRVLELSYPDHGHFYDYVEQPVDLVQC